MTRCNCPEVCSRPHVGVCLPQCVLCDDLAAGVATVLLIGQIWRKGMTLVEPLLCREHGRWTPENYDALAAMFRDIAARHPGRPARPPHCRMANDHALGAKPGFISWTPFASEQEQTNTASAA